VCDTIISVAERLTWGYIDCFYGALLLVFYISFLTVSYVGEYVLFRHHYYLFPAPVAKDGSDAKQHPLQSLLRLVDCRAAITKAPPKEK
jgi:hypothetical protein